MLFCSFAKCTSVREESGAMLGLSWKTKHFQLDHIPPRSTLCDANQRRYADVFGIIYNKLFLKYGHHYRTAELKMSLENKLRSLIAQLSVYLRIF